MKYMEIKIEWNEILSSIAVQFEKKEGRLIIKESICELTKKLRGYSPKRKTDKIASMTNPSAASYEYPTKTTTIPP